MAPLPLPTVEQLPQPTNIVAAAAVAEEAEGGRGGGAAGAGD
jgi:hypothetical protein